MKRGCGLVLLAGLAAACGGRSASEDFAERASENARPLRPIVVENDPGDVPRPVGVSGGAPVPGPIGGGNDEPPGEPAQLPDPTTSEACRLVFGQERIAFHGRDDAAKGCVDLILIRVTDGGVVHPDVALPPGWGIGHLSTYPCGNPTEVVIDEEAQPIAQVTGSIGMQVDAMGLSTSLDLDFELIARTGTVSDFVETPLSFHEVIAVQPACSDGALWARQTLNLRAETNSYLGCRQIGGYDRVVLQQKDSIQGICTRVGLVLDYELQVTPGLSLPEGWGVEDVSAYPCTPDGKALGSAVPTWYSLATGSVQFGGAIGGLPVYVWPELWLSEPVADSSLAPDQVLAARAFSANDFIDVSRGCDGSF